MGQLKRYAWLAFGPLLVLVVGLALLRMMYGPASEPQPKAKGDVVSLPSGLEAELQEMIWNQPGEGLAYRFRFVAEGFQDTEDVEAVMADLEYICTHFALARLANTGPTPGEVIISMADRPSEFGTYDPDVTQVFEAFDIQDGACIWEAF